MSFSGFLDGTINVFFWLVEFGRWFSEHPIQGVVYLVVIVVIAVVLRIILGLWKAIFLVVLLLILSLVVWKFIVPIFSGESVGVSFGFTSEQLEYFALSEEAFRAQTDVGLLQTIAFRGKEEAPDLTGLSLKEGIRLLSEVSEEHAGEVAYIYVAYKNGQHKWSPGSYTEGVKTVVPFKELFEKEISGFSKMNEVEQGKAVVVYLETVEGLTVLHTHPYTLTESLIPPSGQDRNFQIDVSISLPKDHKDFKGIVVQKDWYWEHELDQVVMARVHETFSSKDAKDSEVEKYVALGSQIIELQNVYACETLVKADHPLAPDSCPFSSADKSTAVREYIKVMRELGFIINLKDLDGRSIDIPNSSSDFDLPGNGQEA